MSSLHDLYQSRNDTQACINEILDDVADQDGIPDERQRHWLRVFGGLVDAANALIVRRGADPFAEGRAE